MSETTQAIAGIAMLAITPMMLILPLVVAVLVPNRTETESQRAGLRRMFGWLVTATAASLAVWGGFTFAGSEAAWVERVGYYSWLLFFPLWFGLSMPVVRLKNPAWGDVMHGTQTGAGAVRTASLVNRERRNPVKAWMWVVAVIACVAGLAAIGARGLFPFPEAGGRGLWMFFVGFSALSLLELLLLPRIIRSILSEPEPLDAVGSQELAELYERQRRRRVLGMFWIMGAVMPLCMGGVFALIVWFPELGVLWGLIGGFGGLVLGVVGAVFGFKMTAERARILEARARMNQSRASAAG